MASAPTLINSVEVSEITASKITAGTIGAHEIILTQAGTQTSYTPPSNMAVLRSSNYAAGTNGWLIRGDGLAEFNDLTVRSRLDIGTDPSNPNDPSSFHVDNDGNMWLGAGIYSYSTAPFRVSNTGALVATGVSISGAITATSGTFTGTINASAGTINNTVTIGTNSSSKISIVGTSTANTTAIYSGTSSYGSGGFWIDASGRFSLGDKLAFNGTDLSIAGTVTIGGTAASTVRDGAASGASSLQPGGAASDVNNNVTNISGSKIRTGTIDSNNFNWAGNTTYSIDGTRLDLINGEIISKKFRIDSAGNATFGGTLSSASGSVGAGFSIGGSLSIGDNVRINSATGDGGATVFKVRGNTSSSTAKWIAKFQNNAPDDILSIRDDGAVIITGSLSVNGTAVTTGGPYLPTAGGTLSGDLTVNSQLYISASLGTTETDPALRVNRSYDADGGYFIEFTNTGGTVQAGKIRYVIGSSTSVTYLTTSDGRLKTKIEKELNSTEIIKQLNPTYYKWKNSESEHYGFIAQELYNIIPSAASKGDEEEAFVTESGSLNVKEPWSVDLSGIVPYLVKAVQELSAKVDKLESRLV